jgi:hypothetical protein
MQVSWIDPDEVRSLLAQLDTPPPAAKHHSAWEVHTLPIAPPASTEAVHLLEESVNNDQRIPEPEFADRRPGPGNAELWRIREKLRALREKAQESGILPRLEAAMSAPAVAAEPAPEREAPAPAEVPPATLAEAIAPTADYEPLFSSAGEAPPTAEPSAPTELPVNHATPFVVPALGLGERLAALAEWTCERLGTRDILLVDDFGDVLWGGQSQTPLVLSAMMAWQSSQHSTAAVTTSNMPSRIDKELSGGRSLTILSTRTRYGVVNLAAIGPEPIAEAEALALQDALSRAVEG